MKSIILCGKIKDDRLETWNNNKDPFDILEDATEIEKLGAWTFLQEDKLFSEQVQVDWGSFAYKAKKEELMQLIKKTGCRIKDVEELEDKNIGIVFIEMH